MQQVKKQQQFFRDVSFHATSTSLDKMKNYLITKYLNLFIISASLIITVRVVEVHNLHNISKHLRVCQFKIKKKL